MVYIVSTAKYYCQVKQHFNGSHISNLLFFMFCLIPNIAERCVNSIKLLKPTHSD